MGENSDSLPLINSADIDDVPNILTQNNAQSILRSDGDVANILDESENVDEQNGSDADQAESEAAQNDGDVTETETTNRQPPDPPTVTSGRSGRSRSRRHRRHRHHRRRNNFPGLKGKETNFLAAVCSMVVIVAICTALVEPQWFMTFGGGCRNGDNVEVQYLGMTEFMRSGEFKKVDHQEQKDHNTKYIYRFGHGPDEILYDCVSPKMVVTIRCILSLCFFIILLSLSAFLLDLAGPKNPGLRSLRRYAIFNILAVLCCVVTLGLCFAVSQKLDILQDSTKKRPSSRVVVEFSVSFYLMASAGAMSVIAAACNLLRTNIRHFEQPRDVWVDERNEQLDMGLDGASPHHHHGGGAGGAPLIPHPQAPHPAAEMFGMPPPPGMNAMHMPSPPPPPYAP